MKTSPKFEYLIFIAKYKEMSQECLRTVCKLENTHTPDSFSRGCANNQIIYTIFILLNDIIH
jgi:hypothetical protein